MTRVRAALFTFVLVLVVAAASVSVAVVGHILSAQPPGRVLQSVVSFRPPEAWRGGRWVTLPGGGRQGLELQSTDAEAATADLPGHWNLTGDDMGHMALRIRMYITDPATFDNKIWASRIEFFNSYPLVDAKTAWLDRATQQGWNEISVPLFDMGETGHPSFSGIADVRVTVYSLRGDSATVDFAGIDLITL